MIDIYYIILVLPAAILAMWAQAKVKSTFNKYSKVPVQNGMTGALAARAILDANGLQNVRIERIQGNLTDHYDPRTNIIRLSANVHDRSTVSAVGVAAHEAGHAVQYAVNYAPIKLRASIIPLTNLGSSLSMPLVLLGFIFGSELLMFSGIVLFSLVALFQLITLPVEYNASSRAKEILSASGYVTENEAKGVKKVLSAAALIYVAALLVSVMNIIRLVLLARRRR